MGVTQGRGSADRIFPVMLTSIMQGVSGVSGAYLGFQAIWAHSILQSVYQAECHEKASYNLR